MRKSEEVKPVYIIIVAVVLLGITAMSIVGVTVLTKICGTKKLVDSTTYQVVKKNELGYAVEVNVDERSNNKEDLNQIMNQLFPKKNIPNYCRFYCCRKHVATYGMGNRYIRPKGFNGGQPCQGGEAQQKARLAKRDAKLAKVAPVLDYEVIQKNRLRLPVIVLINPKHNNEKDLNRIMDKLFGSGRKESICRFYRNRAAAEFDVRNDVIGVELPGYVDKNQVASYSLGERWIHLEGPEAWWKKNE